jgi:hypothetical protein
MKPRVKAKSPVLPNGNDFTKTLKGAHEKRTGKRLGQSSKLASSGKKTPRRKAKKANRGSNIRETEEAHALLEGQLHSLYWWVFNAFKMKGFIRAKELAELHGAEANTPKQAEQQYAGRPRISTEK